MSHVVRTQVKFRFTRNRLICWVFRYVHFQHFGELKPRFLDKDHFAKLNNIVTISVFVSLLSWSDVWNLQCLISPEWLEQTYNRKNLPNPNLKNCQFCTYFLSVSLCQFSAFWWPENTISKHLSFRLTEQYSE